MYAVYSTDNHEVIKMGFDYDDLKRTLDAQPQYSYRMESLQTICEELDESEGEARCIPDACEVREWA